ncbi:NDP-hexose 2,3-dehydratase family protein [Streptomyces sp. NPDC048172]|uniref:NDP-hexose 2,3-dehydratase family protein n=1 Tax=Streptomyces sp. NPDC048172 TaxID=3365505 RepID=UPI003721DEA1
MGNASSRLAESVLSPGRVVADLAEFHRRREELQSRVYARAERVPLGALDGWDSDPETGDIRHHSGKFFAIEGLSFRASDGPVPRWDQPIINQPEVGILGILVKEFDGVLHLLMQLKAEPGNRDGLQISPTVQATRSNFTGVHRGKAVPYLEYFTSASPRQTLADVRQSEQGAWFLRKRNRNMVVETTDDVEPLEGFHWLTLGQVHRLLAMDDLVNMDARTVLSCLPLDDHAPEGPGLYTDAEILGWITDVRSRADTGATSVPLRGLTGWRRDEERIAHESGAFFEVIGVRVEAAGREVGRWSQPMIAAPGTGLLALLVARIDGVPHALMHLRVEPGLVDVAELAPTVQCLPRNYAHLPAAARPRFLDTALSAGPEAVLFDTVLSDEGGRFHHVVNRHLIVETDASDVGLQHPEHRWMTVHQLTGLLRHSHYLNVQARSLLACLRTTRRLST